MLVESKRTLPSYAGSAGGRSTSMASVRSASSSEGGPVKAPARRAAKVRREYGSDDVAATKMDGHKVLLDAVEKPAKEVAVTTTKISLAKGQGFRKDARFGSSNSLYSLDSSAGKSGIIAPSRTSSKSSLAHSLDTDLQPEVAPRTAAHYDASSSAKSSTPSSPRFNAANVALAAAIKRKQHRTPAADFPRSDRMSVYSESIAEDCADLSSLENVDEVDEIYAATEAGTHAPLEDLDDLDDDSMSEDDDVSVVSGGASDWTPKTHTTQSYTTQQASSASESDRAKVADLATRSKTSNGAVQVKQQPKAQRAGKMLVTSATQTQFADDGLLTAMREGGKGEVGQRRPMSPRTAMHFWRQSIEKGGRPEEIHAGFRRWRQVISRQ
eukprot:jgi/Chlat1/2143/Chrsp17S02728